MADRCPTGAYDGPLAGRVVGGGAGQQASRSPRDTATANGATTSISARNGGPGRTAGAKVGHRKLTGVPKAEVAGLSNEKVTETSGTRLPSSEPI